MNALEHIDPLFALIVAAVLWAIVLAPHVRRKLKRRSR